MKRWFSSVGVIRRLVWKLMSVPIYLKIIGMGVVVALLFGSVTLIQAHRAISGALYSMLEHELRLTGQSLSAELEKSLVMGDLFAVDQRIQRLKKTFPELQYAIVWDSSGRPVVHTFRRHVPRDLRGVSARTPAASGETHVFACQDGLILDGSFPILNGRAGVLQLGAGDTIVRKRMSLFMGVLFWALGLCVSLGMGLGLGLTFLLTRPIHQLEIAANQIRQGNFEARAAIWSADEIGRLAAAFNQMAESLQQQIRELSEKERARLSLLDRIVQVQEEERRTISRDLHDHIGQSLSAILLKIRSEGKPGGLGEALRKQLEQDIARLIEEAQRLAWGMRPSILDDYGLDSALSRYIQEISKHSTIQIHYHYSLPPGLKRPPPRVEVTFYRVAQEAIRNTVRHAHADQASVVIWQRPETITMVVEDNGSGFDVQAVRRDPRSSIGLVGMAERVGLLGGNIAIESAPGKGTTVRVTVPLV